MNANEELIRSAYAAFSRGDLEGYLQHCSDDIVFRVPGRSEMAGTYTRAQFIDPFISGVMAACDGTFAESILDVTTSETGAAVLLLHEFERKGSRHSYRTIHLYRIENGKLAEFRELPEDLYFFDEAWS